MAKVDADPQSLRDLRNSLQRGQTDIDRAVNGIRSALSAANWHDERRRQFERELEGVLASLRTFSRQADDMKSYLGRKADQLDQFLSR